MRIRDEDSLPLMGIVNRVLPDAVGACTIPPHYPSWGS